MTTSLINALAAIADRFADQLIESDFAEINDVLDAAAEWSAGRLPVYEFAKVGQCVSPGSGRSSSGYTRYLAAVSTPPTDVRRADLLRAIDELIRFQGLVITTKGVFAPADIPDVIVRPAGYEERAA